MSRENVEMSSNDDEHGVEDKKKPKLVFRAGISPVESNKKIGPIRSHLYNYAFAKSEAEKGIDSKIIFRVDDTDKEKHTKEKAEDLFRFFSETLGLKFDVTPQNAEKEIGQSVFQSERQEVYQKRLEELFDKHVAYVDKDSGLALFDIAEFVKQYSDILEIDDLLKGKLKFRLEENLRRGQTAFPLMRSDKSTLYHLASVVDDAAFEVTHVVRGQDKLSIAEYQEMVRVALGLQPKKYLHTPLLLDSSGKLLGGATKFGDFIKQGIFPHAMISYMISSGYGMPEEVYPSLDAFISRFDHKKIHKSNGKFDERRLENINGKIVKSVSADVYMGSLLLYLEKNDDDRHLEILKGDRALGVLLAEIRRGAEEAVRIMDGILEPQYENVPPAFQERTDVVIAALRKEGAHYPEADILASDSVKDLHDVIRWILVGKRSFPNVVGIFSYLRDNGKLQPRIELAARALAEQKDAKLESTPDK